MRHLHQSGSFRSVSLQFVLVAVLIGLTGTVQRSVAQMLPAKQTASLHNRTSSPAGPALHEATTEACAVPTTSFPIRSFADGASQETWVLDYSAPIDSGFVFGTNVYLDRAKSTAFTLPPGIQGARLERVNIWFSYKHTALWSDQYDIYYTVEIYEGTPATGPVGPPLHTQRHALIDVKADNDFSTSSEPTPHELYVPVEVGSTFFVSVDFEEYEAADAGRLSLAATDLLDERVPAVWERLASGDWLNVSDAWFGGNGQPGNQGWHLWMEATVSVDQAYTGTPCLEGQPVHANGIEDYDRFGSSVAVAGRYAVVGSTGMSLGTGITEQGHVSMFYFDGSRWVQQARLGASDQIWGEGFGSAVATNGAFAAAGAYNKGRYDVNDATGTVYVYARNGATWTEQEKLFPHDAAENDNFGYAVAMRGNRMLAGAPGKMRNGLPGAGAVYAFAQTQGSWTEVARFTAAAPQTDAYFGSAVAISDQYAVVGAPGEDHSGETNAGAAYFFGWNGSEWVALGRLVADAPSANARFGESVAIGETHAVVGAPGEEAAYVFRWTGAGWTQQARLTASDGGDIWELHEFGASVAIDEGAIVVGAPGAQRAYVFMQNGSTWTERYKLTASEEMPSLGSAVAFSSPHALVAAPEYEPSRTDPYQGIVMAYDLSKSGVAVEEAPRAASLSLSAPYPNPFTAQATFTLSTHRTQVVTVDVFDVLGRNVAVLHQGVLATGSVHDFTFDATGLPGGTYIVRAIGEDFVISRRLTHVK